MSTPTGTFVSLYASFAPALGYLHKIIPGELSVARSQELLYTNSSSFVVM